MRGLGGLLLGVVALALIVFGLALVVKTVAGGTPDASTGAVVAVGLIVALVGLALGAGALVSMRRTWRR